MSATAVKPASGTWDIKARHRFLIWTAALAGAVLVIALAVYGLPYYLLPPAARTLAARHRQLKPSGSIGHPLGILSGVLFALMFLYPLRKRWQWLGRIGKTKHWLDYHILMGLVAPILITFHSSFKLNGIAGLAYWIMMSVMASGIVGRYLYGRIPRKLDAAEMSLDEMQQASRQLTEQLHSAKVISPQRLERVMRMPSIEEVQGMPLLTALWTLVVIDLKRPFLLWELRREAGGLRAHSPELKQVLEAARKQTALSRNIVFLGKIQKLFHLWHVIHRPFSYSFALLAVLHVVVAMLFGYFGR